MKAIVIIAGMRRTHDDAIMRAFTDSIEKEGIKIEPSTLLAPELLVPKGIWPRRTLTIIIGFNIAKDIGRLDIGQSVVAGGGSSLAVEASEGTDETIKRGGTLGKGEAVLVQIGKPNPDFRSDVPSIGVKTFEITSQY